MFPKEKFSYESPTYLLRTFKTMTPLHQSANETEEWFNAQGNKEVVSLTRTIKVVDTNGQILTSPGISGSSMRGGDRRALFWYTLAKLGISTAEMKETPERRSTYHTFASGGGLEKDETAYDLELQALTAEYFPLLSLYGCTHKTIGWLPGQIGVGIAYPFVERLKELFILSDKDPDSPQFIKADPRDLVTKVDRSDHKNDDYWTYFRKPDNLSVSNKKQENKDSEESNRQSKATSRKNKGAQKTEQAEVESTTDPSNKDGQRNMVISKTYVLPGTPFGSEIVVDCTVTNLEWSALARALQQRQLSPYIGGDSGRGFGLVRWMDGPKDPRLNPKLYDDFLDANHDLLRGILLNEKGFVAGIQEAAKIRQSPVMAGR